MNLNAKVGFYGKLPAVGDFISRRLPPEFIGPWDNWLQGSFVASREYLGSNWLNSYLNSPIWRFLLSPGLCGDKSVVGIIIPSVDKIGRYYPLTITEIIEYSHQVPFLFTSRNDWFEQLEDVALMGLENTLDVETFDQLIQTIPSFFPSISPSFSESIFTFKYSLWVSTSFEYSSSSVKLAYQGLPPVSHFSDLLKGGNVYNQNELIDSENIFNLIVNNFDDTPSRIKSSWSSWAVTEKGGSRKYNEDSILNKPEIELWAVADGMGGHKAGDVASQLIINSLDNLLLGGVLEVRINTVQNCLQQVNNELCHFALQQYENNIVGSTVVVLLFESRRCAVLWAGDSRLYHFRNDQLQQLTQDHCVTNEDPSFDSMVKNPNIITRAVGGHEKLNLDVKITNIFEGDLFLLCSDGLDKEISFHEIEFIMKTNPPENIVNILLSKAMERGARDNISLIIIAPNLI